MDKQFIIDEIRRVATENGGLPLGRDRFERETGIRVADWEGTYWARWNDAVREAGFEPNVMVAAYSDDELLARLALVARDLGHIPTARELRLRRQTDRTLPSDKVFWRFAGSKVELVSRLRRYCEQNDRFADVLVIANAYGPSPHEGRRRSDIEAPIVFGEVYLIKSGQFYKIGRSASADRRARELRIQLPERSNRVHTIRTDDPAGIERYWHERFAAKRRNGEWFKLDAADVSAFRRRKVM